MSRIIEVDLKSEQFTYSIDDQALQQAQLMDGKLMLITNTQDLGPTDLPSSTVRLKKHGFLAAF